VTRNPFPARREAPSDPYDHETPHHHRTLPHQERGTHRLSTEAERAEQLKAAHYNPFLLRSRDVIIDLMTDSGTSAMSAHQWAGMMEGDEAYAGSRSWERMEKAVQDLTGMPARAAHPPRARRRTHPLRPLGRQGKVFISNTHFDTTRANIEFTGATAIDIPIAEGQDTALLHPFKGNMDTDALERLLKEHMAMWVP
jgi:tryptophanase